MTVPSSSDDAQTSHLRNAIAREFDQLSIAPLNALAWVGLRKRVMAESPG